MSEQRIEPNGGWRSEYEPVVEVFRDNFDRHGEIGAGFAVYQDGEPVVDVWAGHRDPAGSTPWSADTLCCVFSATKGVTALAAHLLADRGELDLDAPVTRYWPEFAAGGKERIPVRYLLSHQAGLAATPRPVTLEDVCDWDVMTTMLAEMSPWWRPGELSCYHANTFGWLVGEVIRRISGASVGEFVRRELTEPLGLDFHIGLGAAERDRLAGLEEVYPAVAAMRAAEGLPEVVAAMLAGPWGLPYALDARWQAAQLPAVNGHGTAHGLARMYAALAGDGHLDGVRVLSGADAIERCRAGQGTLHDLFINLAAPDFPNEWGPGYTRNNGGHYGPNPDAFGFTGYGGSFGFADPEHRLAIGYVTNRLSWPADPLAGDPRTRGLVDATYACLAS
ncbi:CubicO group peptidase (beta-lactamase class C family) [Tamaricihabitans halophyticus]|uniref:CubicO group peptidase (Beta-lactamase class C family) n=1 Tax=Tamaricihabitans halophyticus TaxID=1262583 RepID=A0A4R2R110_9PSEU|nr:serine hydrolase domain-containing protein [Tamaricihabitans halophyticus]TCP55269.1 CubicO group peptidase (beta-lactamase class C family) [Tamaricihabitans halophyticus]